MYNLCTLNGFWHKMMWNVLPQESTESTQSIPKPSSEPHWHSKMFLWSRRFKAVWNFQILHDCFLGHSCLCWQASCRVLTSTQVGNKTKPMSGATAAYQGACRHLMVLLLNCYLLNGKKQAWKSMAQMACRTCTVWKKRTYASTWWYSNDVYSHHYSQPNK